jgi:hypothetical protein
VRGGELSQAAGVAALALELSVLMMSRVALIPELSDGFVGTTLPDSAGNPNGRIPPHSMFTTELIDAQGQPTRAAVEEVIAFFRERLPARAAG